MLSLKEKIQKFGGRKDIKENEHPVNLQVSKILKPFNSVTKTISVLKTKEEITFKEKLTKTLPSNNGGNVGGGASTQPVFARTSDEAWNCDKPIASQQQFGVEWKWSGDQQK